MAMVKVDETNKNLTIRSKNFTYHFGPYPKTFLEPSGRQDTKAYFQEWDRLKEDRVHVEGLRNQVRSRSSGSITNDEHHTARTSWQQKMGNLADKLQGMVEQLDEVEKVRQKNLHKRVVGTS
ncbi:MAG: hypothetical protein Q9225_004381 [Loekoesia sp. 1 TL-2023]